MVNYSTEILPNIGEILTQINILNNDCNVVKQVTIIASKFPCDCRVINRVYQEWSKASNSSITLLIPHLSVCLWKIFLALIYFLYIHFHQSYVE